MGRRWASPTDLLLSLLLVPLLLLHPAAPSGTKNAEYTSDTLINNVVLDPRTGRLYVGAVNSLVQLSTNLVLESRGETGPRRDHRTCTPPVTEACEEATDTDNHNKLLLVHEDGGVLVACGSVFRGLCSLRNLTRVENVIYFSDTKGEKSYVASAEEGVSVVGVLSYFKEKERGQNNQAKVLPVFLVRNQHPLLLCFTTSTSLYLSRVFCISKGVDWTSSPPPFPLPYFPPYHFLILHFHYFTTFSTSSIFTTSSHSAFSSPFFLLHLCLFCIMTTSTFTTSSFISFYSVSSSSSSTAIFFLCYLMTDHNLLLLQQ